MGCRMGVLVRQRERKELENTFQSIVLFIIEDLILCALYKCRTTTQNETGEVQKMVSVNVRRQKDWKQFGERGGYFVSACVHMYINLWAHKMCIFKTS